MNQKAIIVCKGGSAFTARTFAARASFVGEQGETEGLLRHLVQRGDLRVIYFGKWRGDRIDGVEVLEPHVDGLDDLSGGDMQRERFKLDVEAMRALLGPNKPIGLLNVAGYSPTMSHINNPNHATVQAASVRYQAPMLNMLEALKLPRLVINNDPRTYPKDQEMSLMLKYARPRSLLDQWNNECEQVVGRKKYRRRSVWARCESWGYIEPRENTGAYPVGCVAHAHIGTGIKTGSAEAWDIVLGGELPESMVIYGAGWDKHPLYDPELMPGPITPAQVSDVLSQCVCCPVVSHTPGFYTGKPYVLVANGCIPILFGDGAHKYTYDPYGHMMPLRTYDRIVQPGDLKLIVDSLWDNEVRRDTLLRHWRKVLEPDFTKLDKMLGCLIEHGTEVVDARWWFEEFGGYAPL